MRVIGLHGVDGGVLRVRLGRVKKVSLHHIILASSPNPSRLPAKGLGLECARMLCNCGKIYAA